MADQAQLKVGGGELTAAELALRRTIRHAVYLERFKSHEVRRILAFLNDQVTPDLLAKVEAELSRIVSRGFEAQAFRSDRYRSMLQSVQAITRAGLRETYSLLETDLGVLARDEPRMLTGALRDSIPIEFEFTAPSTETLRSIVTSRPMRGKILREWFDDLSRGTAQKVQEQIGIGIAEGEGTDQIVRRLRGTRAAGFSDGILEQTRNGTEAVVRTAVNHVSTHAREAVYEANSDLVKGVQWVSTLDSRTTPYCQAHDGKVYDVGEGPRPPGHYGCRSTTTPVLKSWKELGINLKEAPEGTRASMDGQVPASTTYGEWLADASKADQDEALGPARADLFRRGLVTIDRFVDERGRTLSLAEIRRREGL